MCNYSGINYNQNLFYNAIHKEKLIKIFEKIIYALLHFIIKKRLIISNNVYFIT